MSYQDIEANAVRLLRNGKVVFDTTYEYEDRSDQEVWKVYSEDSSKEESDPKYQVRFIKEYRTYSCTCTFGSLHNDKNGLCKHIEAVSLLKKLKWLNDDIIETIRTEFNKVNNYASWK